MMATRRSAIAPGDRVLIGDDVLATGGTLAAASRLVEDSGGQLAGCAVLVEIAALAGRVRLGHARLVSIRRA